VVAEVVVLAPPAAVVDPEPEPVPAVPAVPEVEVLFEVPPEIALPGRLTVACAARAANAARVLALAVLLSVLASFIGFGDA